MKVDPWCCCVVEDDEGEEHNGEVQDVHEEDAMHGLNADEGGQCMNAVSSTPSGLRHPDCGCKCTSHLNIRLEGSAKQSMQCIRVPS